MNVNESPPLHEVALGILNTGVVPDQPQKLTRRNRHVLLDFEIFGDHATTWFVRRGHSGEPVDESYNFVRSNGVWRSTGGGGASPGADLASRPTIDELVVHNEMIGSWRHFPDFAEPCDFARYDGASYGSGPVSFRMQLGVGVAELRFSDREPRPVASHGYAIVIYNPKRPPTMSAFGPNGESLGQVGFMRQPRLPWRR